MKISLVNLAKSGIAATNPITAERARELGITAELAKLMKAKTAGHDTLVVQHDDGTFETYCFVDKASGPTGQPVTPPSTTSGGTHATDQNPNGPAAKAERLLVDSMARYGWDRETTHNWLMQRSAVYAGWRTEAELLRAGTTKRAPELSAGEVARIALEHKLALDAEHRDLVAKHGDLTNADIRKTLSGLEDEVRKAHDNFAMLPHTHAVKSAAPFDAMLKRCASAREVMIEEVVMKHGMSRTDADAFLKKNSLERQQIDADEQLAQFEKEQAMARAALEMEQAMYAVTCADNVVKTAPKPTLTESEQELTKRAEVIAKKRGVTVAKAMTDALQRGEHLDLEMVALYQQAESERAQVRKAAAP